MNGRMLSPKKMVQTIINEWAQTAQRSWLLAAHPVNSIYISVNNTSPATLFGGTWERWAKGRVLVGVNESDTDFKASSQNGGAKAVTLTPEQMPSHKHDVTVALDGRLATMMVDRGISATPESPSWGAPFEMLESGYAMVQGALGWTGGSKAHSNLQPYVTVYMWRRTA